MGVQKRAFTLIELLVVIAIIAVLMAILMPALNRVKKQARTSACLANLRQWGLLFSMYCDDNDGYFFTGEVNGTRDNVGSGEFWRETMRPYTKSFTTKLWLCPQATKTLPQGGIPQSGWSYYAWENGNDVGSYCLNGWMLNIKASKVVQNRNNGWGRTPADWHWGTCQVPQANNVPIFTGGWWVDTWPREDDQPPANDEGPGDTPNSNEMNRVCVNRHDGFVNGVFADFSVRKIGLKELWTLKWSKGYNTAGRWTRGGGCQPSAWPEWLQRFKDY